MNYLSSTPEEWTSKVAGKDGRYLYNPFHNYCLIALKNNKPIEFVLVTTKSMVTKVSKTYIAKGFDLVTLNIKVINPKLRRCLAGVMPLTLEQLSNFDYADKPLATKACKQLQSIINVLIK